MKLEQIKDFPFRDFRSDERNMNRVDIASADLRGSIQWIIMVILRFKPRVEGDWIDLFF